MIHSFASGSTESDASATSPIPLYHEGNYNRTDGAWIDFNSPFALEDQAEPQQSKVPSLSSSPRVRGRILATVPVRRLSGSVLKHKRKEEMIQKQLAHRKRSSSEPPSSDRPESKNNTCSGTLTGTSSTPSPFFNRLAKVKNLQKELREQQRLPLCGSEQHSVIPAVGEMKDLLPPNRSHSTSDIDSHSKTFKSASPSAEHVKEENRDIRMKIIRKRGGSLPALPGGVKESRFSVYKESSTAKDESPAPTKAIALAKLREHRRRKLGIVNHTTSNYHHESFEIVSTPLTEVNGFNYRSAADSKQERNSGAMDPDVAIISQVSESLGSLGTDSTPSGETEIDGISDRAAFENAFDSKLGKNVMDCYDVGSGAMDTDCAFRLANISQRSESLGSLVTESMASGETEMDGITHGAAPRSTLKTNAVDCRLNRGATDPDCYPPKDDYDASISNQGSESLGSLETESTLLTETRDGITSSVTESEHGYTASYYVLGSVATGSDSTSQGDQLRTTTTDQCSEADELFKWTSFDRTEYVMETVAACDDSMRDSNAGKYPGNKDPIGAAYFSVAEIGREDETPALSKHYHGTGLTAHIETGIDHEGMRDTADSPPDAQETERLTAYTDGACTQAPLALSADGSRKSFDFRQIEAPEKLLIDPSWDANKVYFNEFDNGKKTARDGVDVFESENDDWISPSPVGFSSTIRSYPAGLTTTMESTAHFQEQVEEEKKERDSASLDGNIDNGFMGSDSNIVDFNWPTMDQFDNLGAPVADDATSDLEESLEGDLEADDANLLRDSSSPSGSSSGDEGRQRKEERIQEYNTFEVDEESSIEGSDSDQSEPEDITPDYVPQLNHVTEDGVSLASEQSDVFDFTEESLSRVSTQFDPCKCPIATPLENAAPVIVDVLDDKDGSGHVPWDEMEPSLPLPSTVVSDRSFLPPPPPPSPRVSSPKRSQKASKCSKSIPLIAPPPPEKLKQWEEEKVRPLEHLQKLHSTIIAPPPPPPPPPKSLFQGVRRLQTAGKDGKSSSSCKQAIESRENSASSAVVFSDTRMAEKVDTGICATSLKLEEISSSFEVSTSNLTNGQRPSHSVGLTSGSNNDITDSHTSAINVGNGEDIDETYHCREPDQTKSSRRWLYPDEEPCPFGEAISKVPVLISRILEFLGDPVAVCRIKMLNRSCKKYVEENEHLLMRDAVRLGGISMQVRPAFWLWVTLEKMNDPRNNLREEGSVVELERQGREGKWHNVIERDVARAFGNLPPHKSGARLRTDSIVRALVSWGRGRMIKRGVKGDGEAPPPVSNSNSYDSDVTPTDTVSDWGAVAPASSTASELDEPLRSKNKEVVPYPEESKGELALSGSVLPEDLKTELRGKLSFILHTLAASNPDVGYCQGMDYVVAHLLRILQETIRWKAALGTLPDIIKSAPAPLNAKDLKQESIVEQYSKIDSSLVVEDTLFHVMESFFGTYNLRHFYYPELRCLKTCCRVFERLIQLKLPVLADHFEHHELNVGLFALGWFQTLFLYLPSMPSATVCHMWDIWLVERSFKIFFRVGTAILFLSQPILLNNELEGMMSYLNTFPDATLLSPDILIACALQIKVTNKLLMRLEREVISEAIAQYS